MARRAFYSFHYKPDNWRAAMVRNIGSIEGNRPATDNDWEAIKKGGATAIKKWIAKQLKNRSCTVVLVGSNTTNRKWIRYEIVKSWNEGMGVVGIRIHGLKDANGNISPRGANPFAGISFEGSGKLVRHRGRVGRVAGIGLHGHRAAALAVAAVAAAHQRAGAACVVAARDVVQDLGILAEVTAGEASLDAVLALQEPVHGGVEVLFVGVLETKFGGRGGAVPEARGGELGGGMQQALGDHGEHGRALGRGGAVEQGGQAQAAQGLQHEFDMAVGAGADDGAGLVGAA